MDLVDFVTISKPFFIYMYPAKETVHVLNAQYALCFLREH